MKYNLVVKEVLKTTKNTKDLADQQLFTLKLVHKNGVPKINITSDEPFNGYNPEDRVTVNVKLDTSQTSLDDVAAPKKKSGKKKK